VLLLFIFAAFMPEKIEQSKRLAKYDKESAVLLLRFVQNFERILTTAHVLAETSNLARQNVGGKLWERMASQIHPLFCLIDPRLDVIEVDRTQIPLATFTRLGLTDAAIASALSAALLLTDDLDLYVTAVTQQSDALNFTHMREAAGIL
jgi:hypothetical protein